MSDLEHKVNESWLEKAAYYGIGAGAGALTYYVTAAAVGSYLGIGLAGVGAVAGYLLSKYAFKLMSPGEHKKEHPAGSAAPAHH